jgi:hypothetical protein
VKRLKRSVIFWTVFSFVLVMGVYISALCSVGGSATIVWSASIASVILMGSLTALTALLWYFCGRGKPAGLGDFSRGERLTVTDLPEQTIIVTTQYGGHFMVYFGKEGDPRPQKRDIIGYDHKSGKMRVVGRVIEIPNGP